MTLDFRRIAPGAIFWLHKIHLTMDEVTEEIIRLQNKISVNTYDISNHDRLIELLRIKKSWETLRTARTTKLHLRTFTSKEYSEWLIDEKITNNKTKMVEYYEFLILERPTAFNWNEYLVYAIDNLTDTDISALFPRALDRSQYDFKHAHLVWRTILDQLILQDEESETVIELFKQWLSIPHEKLDESFQFFSLYITHIGGDYEALMLPVNKIYADTVKSMRHHDYFEIPIAENSSDPNIWIKYMQAVKRYTKDFGKVLSIFERSVELNVHNENWIPVWLEYLYMIYEGMQMNPSKNTNSLRYTTLNKFVRSFPNKTVSYAEYIRNCSDIRYYNVIRDRITLLDLMNTTSYDEWKILALAILQYDKKFDVNNISRLENDLTQFMDFALKNNDLFHSVEKLVVTLLTQINNLQRATYYVDRMLSVFQNQHGVWHFAAEFVMKHYNYSKVHELFLNALSQIEKIEWGERILEEWLLYEQLWGPPSEYNYSVVLANDALKRICVSREKQANKKRSIDEVEDQETLEPKKLKLGTEPKRAREDYCIKVSNIAASVTEEVLRTLFKECGEIREFKFINVGESAVIEFATEQGAFAALTKDKKILAGQELKVIRFVESTVFATNYPPSYTPEQVKNLFSRMGTLTDVRYPAQMINAKAKRFCFVEYTNSDAAKKAILLLNGKELNDESSKTKFKLLVCMSDPSKIKERDAGSPMSERKVRIENLPYKYSENDIKKIFSQLEGEIELITIPKINLNRSKTQNNDGVAVVLFKSAEYMTKALEKNGEDVDNRILKVSKVGGVNLTDNQSRVSKFSAAATIGVTNVDKILTSEQVKAHFQKLVGQVKKAEVFPGQNCAIVEFEKVADAGKAAMLPENNLNGKRLEIVSKSDILAIVAGKKAVKSNNMVPPALLRRIKR